MKYLPNILIVDDSKVNLVILENVINNFEVNIIQALSGAEALEKIQGIELALAIIDICMPKMDGYELALNINKDRPEAKVPIIFVTAGQMEEADVIKGYESGAVDYIFKPISSRVLQSKIHVFLDLFNQRQSIIKSWNDITVFKEPEEDIEQWFNL